MSSIRKMKRQMLKEWAREGKKPAEEMAKAAALEMHDVQKKASEFGLNILGAMAMVVMNDYGKLKNRSMRLESLCKLVNQRYLDIMDGKLTESERKIYEDFGIIFAANWIQYKEDKKEG